MPSDPLSREQGGFTLVEMAIVLIIVLLLMSGLAASLSGEADNRARNETERTLSEIHDALLGFAATQSRLPCPAAPALMGQGSGSESLAIGNPGPGGHCSHPYDGMVPGLALGLSPTDPQGYVLDGWNRRIRYAVTEGSGSHAYAFTTPSTPTTGMKGNANLTTPPSLNNLNPDLIVCSSLNGAGCATNATLTNHAVAILFSLGKNGAGTGSDENENRNGDAIFVSHAPTVSNAAGGEFDDLVIWLSPYILYGRMITAGLLP